jgi:hypothetical protein
MMENEKNTFPITKIKAQLLRDDNVGRVSTKAVELIAACSSLFVNDLVTKSIETAPTRKASSKTKNDETADDVALVTLRQIKKSVKTSQEYSFLDGVLDGVSERAAFKYDAAAAKKRKRLEDNNNNTKEKNNSSKKSTSVAKLPVEARESVDDNNKVENKALREAIDTASQSNGGAGKGNTIIEDEDDYD